MTKGLLRGGIVGVLALAGSASGAFAQTNDSVLRFEVRQVGAADWSSDIEVAPGAIVEFRGVISYVGTAPAVGLQRANFQPTLANWHPADLLQPFRAWGVSTSPTPPGIPASGVAADSGEYGRILPYAFAGISSANALRGHTHNVAGINYLRVSQANATNWVGVGPSSGVEAANNFNGVLGLALGQRPPILSGESDPNFVAATTDVEVVRLAVQINGGGLRTLVVDAPIEGFSAASIHSDIRGVAWYASLESSGAPNSLTWGSVTVTPALIRVPNAGTLALLGLGVLVGPRRRIDRAS